MTKYRLAEFHTGNNDLNARWYYEYYFLNPNTGKFQRFREYKGLSKIKTVEARIQKIQELTVDVNRKLLSGWSPFDIHQVLHPEVTEQGLTTVDALRQALKAKKLFQTENGEKTMRSHVSIFIDWLINNNLGHKHPTMIRKPDIVLFLNSVLASGCTNRTRNNYLIDISACFQYMFDQMEIIPRNPCKGINDLPSKSEVHKAFTGTEVKDIGEWMNRKDPYMAFYCRFITSCFLRPIEIQRMRVRDIDINSHQIIMQAKSIKQGKRQKKLIPKPLANEIKQRGLDKYPKDWFVFGANMQPSPMQIGKNYFSKHFRKLKNELGFEPDHTMYGLKHTFICMLIENGADPMDVMKLTDHDSLESFEKYLRSIGAKPKKDLSNLYTINI